MLYMLFSGSGLREGEAFGLEIPHFIGDSLTIKQQLWNGVIGPPKTVAGVRTVDLAPELAARLRQFIGTRKSGYVFRTAKGTPLHASNVLRRSLHPILASMGRGEDWKAGFHAFRRYRVTWLRKQNVPEQLIDYWIGHSTDKTVTDGYSKICEDGEFRKLIAARVGTGLPDEIFGKLAIMDPNGPLDVRLSSPAQVLVM